jgi:hypothetical protein
LTNCTKHFASVLFALALLFVAGPLAAADSFGEPAADAAVVVDADAAVVVDGGVAVGIAECNNQTCGGSTCVSAGPPSGYNCHYDSGVCVLKGPCDEEEEEQQPALASEETGAPTSGVVVTVSTI